MSINLFTFVDMYSKGLTTLAHILDKGATLAKSKGSTEDEMLEWRLVDDMNPVRFQAFVAINYAKRWPARAAGVEVPPEIASDLDYAGLRAAIDDAKTFLTTLKAEQFAGRDEVTHTENLGGFEPTLPLGQWLTSFATTNFYFHLSMAYAILRARGAELGKRDLFAGGL